MHGRSEQRVTRARACRDSGTIGVLKGILLGALNVLVVAIAMSRIERSPEVFALVAQVGMVPGICAGAVLGALAHLTRTRPPRWRFVLITALASSVVFALGWAFDSLKLAPSMCVPTAIAALALELWTRRPPPPPRIPVATAQSK